MYGIWIFNSGWLKGKEDVIAFDSYDFACEVAKIIKAKVRRIDDTWKDLEDFYLQQDQKESRTLWQSFKNLFKHKTNT